MRTLERPFDRNLMNAPLTLPSAPGRSFSILPNFHRPRGCWSSCTMTISPIAAFTCAVLHQKSSTVFLRCFNRLVKSPWVAGLSKPSSSALVIGSGKLRTLTSRWEGLRCHVRDYIQVYSTGHTACVQTRSIPFLRLKQLCPLHTRDQQSRLLYMTRAVLH